MESSDYRGRNGIFARRLVGLLKDNGTSQVDFARAIGVKPQTVSQYVHGDTLPVMDTLAAIARYFNVSSDYLIGLTNVKSVSAEERAISEETGLSVETILNLSYKYYYDGERSIEAAKKDLFAAEKNVTAQRFINDLVCDDTFDTICDAYESFLNAVEKVPRFNIEQFYAADRACWEAAGKSGSATVLAPAELIDLQKYRAALAFERFLIARISDETAEMIRQQTEQTNHVRRYGLGGPEWLETESGGGKNGE